MLVVANPEKLTGRVFRVRPEKFFKTHNLFTLYKQTI